MGLYISKRIVELMRGRIWAESEGLGKGSTFAFTLPVASEEVLKNASSYTVMPKGGTKELEPMAI